ncbi:NACHT, LRR and PYD domains-containing protein 3-like isoform X2 [Ruditapes philippinarum]|uniref:NACHT, LRR and PYD domains-containing protein 3-like isoform X2 n=1 Tax=Ruditapes philippinarum TaxID=129788 RepID=UPI00295B0A2D|nr:NACHT, LRR and PYD domains-containing protein 3-like isoform X2 [Ruditapes philippinarum]
MYDFHSLPRKRHYSIRLDVIRESVSMADISKPIPLIINYNNNNNNGLKTVKKDSNQGNGRSWKFWKSMTLRSSKSAKPIKMDSSLPNLDGQLPDVVEKSEFTRSLSLRPPPKPPRAFVLRANSLKTPKPCPPVTVDGKHDLNTQENIPPVKSLQADENTIQNAKNGAKDYENVDSEGITLNLPEKPNIVPLTISQKCSSLPNYTLGPSVTRRQPTKSSGKIKIVSPELTRKVPPRPRKKSAEITAGDRHILILQSAAELICQKIDPFVVIEKLADAGLMDESDLNAYRNPYESRQLCDTIVQSIMDRDYVSFLKFCDILRSVTDYTTVAAVLDAMIAVYDVIYEVQITNGDTSPILDDEKTVSFDVVYFSLETGKVRSVVELEKLRNSENKRHSRDLLSYKRNSRLSFQSFQSLTSEASSVFSEDIITNGLPMVTVSISGHVLCLEKARSLATVIEDHYCILEFHIGKTHLRGSDMEHISRALAQNSCIRVLDLRLNNIGNSGAVYMANVLYQNRTLRQLNLSSTGIDSEGCKLLADSLRTNTSLIDLDLSFLDIGDSGCMALSGMLKQNRCLKKLRLRSGSITWIGCGFLLEGIEIGRTVTELDLSRNFIDDTGAEMFLRHLKDDSCLREVNLENCGITSAGCSILSDVILTNKSLRNLDLSVNFIGDQGILKLSNALDRNKHIKTLGLNMCGISNDGFSKLLDILEGNATLTMLKLCYNRLGREHSNPEATSDNLKYRVRIVTSSNPKLKLLLWGNTFEESNTNAMSQFKDLNATL